MSHVGSAMKRRFNYFFILISIAFTIVFFQNCGQSGDIQLQQDKTFSSTSAAEQIIPLPEDSPEGGLDQVTPVIPPASNHLAVIEYVNIRSSEDYVCEPFNSSTTSVSGTNGLKGKLAYYDVKADADVATASSLKVKQYWDENNNIVRPAQDLYFNQINVIPMKFDSGFTAANGSVLKKLNSQTLVEWFGIKYETLLTLKPDQAEGYYKLASISDDGVIVEAYIDNKWVEIINNDGLHSPRFMCQFQQGQNQALYLSRNSKIPLRIYYHQGPKVHIANMLLMKHLGAEIPGSAVVGCENDNNTNLFSDPVSGPTVPSQAYLDLITAGWGVIAKENFLLPNEEINPCSQNQLKVVNHSSFPSMVVEGKHIVSEGILALEFFSSFASEAEVSLSIVENNVETLLSVKSSISGTFDMDKHKHAIQLSGLSSSSKYKLDVVLISKELNLKTRKIYYISK